MNKFRGTDKDMSMLKNAVRRVFSRSDYRHKVLATAKIVHVDTNRKRVKNWYLCALCKEPNAAYQMQVDHIEPIVGINQTLVTMDISELVGKTWCHEGNLQVLCLPCHKNKTKLENAERRRYKKQMSTAYNNNKKQKKLFRKIKTKNKKKAKNGK